VNSQSEPDSRPQTFLATVVCKDGQEVPKVEAYIRSKEARGAIRPQTAEMLDLLLMTAKTLRKSLDESWEILNPRKSGIFLEFDIRRIEPEIPMGFQQNKPWKPI
jgi:hypothetical protein